MKTPQTTKKEKSFDGKICSHLFCYLEMLKLAKKLERELIKSRKLLRQNGTINKISNYLKR